MTSVSQAEDSYSQASLSGGEIGDYFALLKPRVMSLVIFTALVGMIVSHQPVHPVLAFASLLSIAVGAGASGCLNMWWDADIDAIMARTKTRPIPSGKVTREEALAFGLTLSLLSVLTLGLASNWQAAALLAFTIFFYAVVYSMWLKRSTPQNIVIGGAAGALPPLIGQASLTGVIGLEGIILFLIIFIWTPPHFWALALIKSEDYAKVGVPMMPNVAGPQSTRLQILLYTLVLAPFGLTPVFLSFAGIIYAATAFAGGLAMLGLAWRVYRYTSGDAEKKACGQMFGYSILYLFALFAALLFEHGFGLLYSMKPILGLIYG